MCCLNTRARGKLNNFAECTEHITLLLPNCLRAISAMTDFSMNNSFKQISWVL